jgi:CBS domain-containing protein
VITREGLLDARAGELSLFVHRVRDFVKRPPVVCAPKTSAVDIARTLTREAVGSLVVVGDDGAPIGIVTDRDLRQKLFAAGRDSSTTVATDLMSTPIVSLPPDAFGFEALLEMTRWRIRHIVLLEEGRVVGVVSSRDFLVLHTTHPVMLTREITRAGTVSALADVAARSTQLVRRLVDEGGAAHDIGHIVAEVNDRIVLQVLTLTADALARQGVVAPPVAYCWIALGSEARREQTLRTDQDNALIYGDPPPELSAPAATYYARFAEEAVRGLIQVGFPRCPADSMASNPRWCQSLSVWMQYVRSWIGAPTLHVLDASIYFDLRALAGARDLADRLVTAIHREAAAHRTFLAVLARDVVTRRVPLTLVRRRVAVRRRPPHAGQVDVKGAGSIQLVGAARVHALEFELVETNTRVRFERAASRGLYSAAEVREITDAHDHLLRLRLVHQLAQIEHGEAPDNYVNPEHLSHADAVLFREALVTVRRVQAGLREHFQTDLLAGV